MFEKELYDLQVSLPCRSVKRSIARMIGRIHITTWSDTDLDSHKPRSGETGFNACALSVVQRCVCALVVFYVKRRYLLRENAIEWKNVFPD
ncbi:hypothetical protein DPMN_061003 [Dreissena polymorpha]|uniref:Uncharacterized protein n=1 Tax=Dreissena polymorpha TaxID=45954 RepID=A0A9D4HI05_DREPO|nr:hypothetical protein DPMN_061003 [Dreissena polymorpha]